MSRRQHKERSIVIRREEVVEGGHHGGAWKVAYADFVTAMMAFFLLMWLLNATTQEQKRGLADYFSPNSHLSNTTSGIGAPFGGRAPNSEGALLSDRGSIQITRTQPFPTVDDDEDTGETPTQVSPSKVPGSAPLPNGREPAQAGAPPPTQPAPSEEEVQQEIERREKRAFGRAAQQMREAVA